MKSLSTTFLLFSTMLSCFAAGPRVSPTFTLPTVSALTNRVPISNEVVMVLGYNEAGDWGASKPFRWDATNTATPLT